MRTLVSSVLFAAVVGFSAGSAGCGGDDGDASCDKVVDHTLKLMPAELKDHIPGKKDMVQQCEKKMSKAERKCALSAKSMEDLMKCKQKKKS